MTLDLNSLRSNLAELCSASNSCGLVPSITGRSVYNASLGLGTVYRYFYVLCSFSGKEPPVNYLLKDSLKHTAHQYELAVKTAKTWLENRIARKDTSEDDLEVVVFLASFHKSCRKNNLLKRLQSLFQNHGGLHFTITDIPHLDFYRRVDSFERITSTPFPFELLKKAIAQDAPDELKGSFAEYEKKILDSLSVSSYEEKAKRKARIIDKLVKIIKDLGQRFQVDAQEVYSIWGRMGCRDLLAHVSEKRKRALEALDKFKFNNIYYCRNKSIPLEFHRLWTAVPLVGTHKEVIVFHSVLAGALLSRDRKEKEIIPINPSKKYNPEMGLLLKKGHSQAWIDVPLKEYEEELIALIKELSLMKHLPVDPHNNLMELESYGFDWDNQLTVKLNYTEAPYHIFILHDFLFKACKKNAKDYIRLVKASKLDQAPMGQQVGGALLGHLNKDERKIKFAASKADASEHDFQKYWIDPFHPVAKFIKERDGFEVNTVSKNYLERAFGCYPFEGVLEMLLN